MSKVVGYISNGYTRRAGDKQISVAECVTGSVYDAGDDDGQLERIASRLTKLSEIVGALAEYAVRSGDAELISGLNDAMHYRYSIEVE